MDPLDGLANQLLAKALTFLVPAALIAGLIGAFKKDVERWMVRRLRDLFHGKAKPSVPRQPKDISPSAEPCCPECSRTMTMRTARKGENRGTMFWGCTGFPSCRGTRNAA